MEIHAENTGNQCCRHEYRSNNCKRTYFQIDPVAHRGQVDIKEAMTSYLLSQIRFHGCMLPEAQLREIWETDLELNAQGLCVWLDSLAA